MYASGAIPSTGHERRTKLSTWSSPEPIRPTKDRAASLAGATAFALAFLAYVLLTPWVAAHWPVTGDEPHYLLISHSLLADADIRIQKTLTYGAV